MSPEVRGHIKGPEPRWSWQGFPKRANRLISDFIGYMEVPDCDTNPEFCSERASSLWNQVNDISLALKFEYKGTKPQIPYNPLADAFLARAVVLSEDSEVELASHLVELSDEIRFLAKSPESPHTSLIHPNITPGQMMGLL